MSKPQMKFLLALRLALGVLFFYAGLSKILNPEWTAAGFLLEAQTFSGFYVWMADESRIAVVNFLNQWGLLAIGLGLFTGTLTRYAAYAGMILMALYYFPVLTFPYVDHGFLVDDHVIYFFALGLLAVFNAGTFFGIDQKIAKRK